MQAAAARGSTSGSCSCSRASTEGAQAAGTRRPVGPGSRRRARRERAPKPTNPLPFSRGNYARAGRADGSGSRARPGAEPDPARASRPGRARHAAGSRRRESVDAPGIAVGAAAADAAGRAAAGATRGRCGGRFARRRAAEPAALRAARSVRQPQGGGGQFGPEIQFDTKGVEFGPWIRRFIAQVKRNWLIPYAAMSMKGHVVITFNVHKDGIDHRSDRRRPVSDRRVQQRRVRRAGLVEPDAAAAAGVSGRTRRSSPSRSSTTKTPPSDAIRPVAADSACVLLGCWSPSATCSSCALIRRDEAASSSRFSGRPRPARARWRSRWPSATAARSSTAIRPPSIAASTSAPTRCRSPSGAASRITSSTSSIRPRSTRRRSTRAMRRRRFARFTRAAGCRFVVGRHRLLLPRADARAVSRARAATRRCARGSKRSPRGAASTFLHRMLARVDPRVGAPDPAARSEAHRARARGVLPDRAVR